MNEPMAIFYGAMKGSFLAGALGVIIEEWCVQASVPSQSVCLNCADVRVWWRACAGRLSKVRHK